MATLTKSAQVSLPPLDEVLRNPACLETLDAHALAALALKASALVGTIASALLAADSRVKAVKQIMPTNGKTISADEACALLHQPRHWLSRNARRLPFVIKLSPKKIIVDESALRAWLAAHAAH